MNKRQKKKFEKKGYCHKYPKKRRVKCNITVSYCDITEFPEDSNDVRRIQIWKI